MKRYKPQPVAGLLICLLVTTLLSSCHKGPSDQPPVGKTVAEQQSARTDISPRPLTPGSTIDEVIKRGELRVGMQVGYTPFEMDGKGGSVVGFDADMAGMVAKALKVNLNLVRRTWGELIPALLDGQIDIVMSGMTVSPDRNAQAMFTSPVVETGRMYMVHVKNVQRFRKLVDLNHPGVFVVAGPRCLGEIKIGEVLPEASYREFPDALSALNEVLEGRAHAIIDEEFAIRLAAATYSDRLASSFEPITYEPIGWAVRPDDNHWLNWLNNFLLTVQRDGRMDVLKKKWLHDYFLDIPQEGTAPKTKKGAAER